MITRMLPPEEWHRLMGTEAEGVWPHLDSLHAQVMVVEDGGQIVGTWTLFTMVHAECLWIAPTHRGKASVARRLWAQLLGLAHQMGISNIATAAVSDDVRSLLAHVNATKLDGDHYIMRMPCQPQ